MVSLPGELSNPRGLLFLLNHLRRAELRLARRLLLPVGAREFDRQGLAGPRFLAKMLSRAAGLSSSSPVKLLGEQFVELGSPRPWEEGFAELPILEKETLKSSLRELVYPWTKRVWEKRTGGSTGVPTPILVGPIQRAVESYLVLRGQAEVGWRFGDPIVLIWGRDFNQPDTVGKVRTLADWIHCYIPFRGWQEEGYLDLIRSALTRPGRKWLLGFASKLFMVADSLARQGLGPKDFSGLKGVIPAAEVILPQWERRLREVFGAPLYPRYGARDGGPIAFTCRAGRLHYHADALFLEVVDEEGRRLPPGEEGDLLITQYFNDAMPLVRYRIGDRVVLAPPEERCECGLGLPVIDTLSGRVNDIFINPAGRKISPIFFPHLLKDYPLARYQVRQVGRERLVLVVEGELPSREQREEIARLIRQAAGFPQVEFEAVERIPQGEKFRFLVREEDGG